MDVRDTNQVWRQGKCYECGSDRCRKCFICHSCGFHLMSELGVTKKEEWDEYWKIAAEWCSNSNTTINYPRSNKEIQDGRQRHVAKRKEKTRKKGKVRQTTGFDF